MEITIREAEKREVAEFFYKAFPPDAISPAMLEWDRVQACDEMYVATKQGQIVGAVTLATTGLYGGTKPTLATLFTSRACRRNGVGGQLCERAIRRFIELGKTSVYVDATTKGMKALLARLPDDLQNKLDVHYSVDSQGDEWELFDSSQA